MLTHIIYGWVDELSGYLLRPVAECSIVNKYLTQSWWRLVAWQWYARLLLIQSIRQVFYAHQV